ncbi:MAG: NAD(+) synthase [Bacteroidales bacterium]|nr:NAD(+) synthase [Bacteroidales bacterium]
MNYGFVRVAAAVPEVLVADCMGNAVKCYDLICQAQAEHVQIVCFPELNITGYTCADLFHSRLLVSNAEKALGWLLEKTAGMNIIAIVGLPVRCSSSLFNAAVVFKSGKIIATTAKSYLPNYNEFYEKRWFASIFEAQSKTLSLCGQTVPFERNIIFEGRYASFSIEICEDLWTPVPPSSTESLAGAHIIFNLSASDEILGKNHYLKSLIEQQSARCIAGYVYASCGFGESSTDLYFAGNGYIAENGNMIAQSKRFSFESQLVISDIDVEKLSADREKNTTFMMGVGYAGGGDYSVRPIELPEYTADILARTVDAHPFVPSDEVHIKENCQEIFSIQIGGLATRLKHIHCEHVVVGISGGLDSTLALLVAAKTFDKLGIPRKNIIGITMPGFGTTGRTYKNAIEIMKALGIEIREINIKDACVAHFADIGHDPSVHDTIYENSQARERTQILMDIANQNGAIVAGTGDMSELALGWCTYNGDHMSMYAVNAGVPKTLVTYLVKYAADYEVDIEAKSFLYDVIETPISPELLPADEKGNIDQKTEDLVGPYELHYFFLYHTLRNGFAPRKILFLASIAFKGQYDTDFIQKWLKVFIRRFFTQQFKRSCMPDSPKVGSVALSPRGDWRMPSDACFNEWIKDL